MSWFTRGKASRFPGDMLQRLELLGRFTLDARASGIESDEIWLPCVAPFVEDARADRAGFLADLHALATTAKGGFAVLGAAALVWELCGSEALDDPAARPLIDAGIDFKLARGLPPGWTLTGYEMRRHLQRIDIANSTKET